MTELQKQQHRARMQTLERVRAEVDAESRIHIRAAVFCPRSLPSWRVIPKTVLS